LLKPLFVYGTLRPGDFNYPVVQPALVAATPGHALGQLFHVRGGTDEQPRFPVAVFYADGIIRGELLVLADDEEVWQMVRFIELGSGYEEVEVPVLTASGNAFMATSYHWPHAQRGSRIPSGDWRDVRRPQNGS
jgi:gamma-glutamylcyclotransferase (GGCT)/AIG2-like uncharacterized protein YtfP